MAVFDRLRRIWNAFAHDQEEFQTYFPPIGPSYSVRPDRTRLRFYNERSIISSVYTRIAIDAAGVEVRHTQLDKEERYLKDVDSKLNYALLMEPNLDQGPRAFRQDVVMTMMDKGVAAVVPVDTVGDPSTLGEFDIVSIRVGEIVEWYPRHIKVSLYNVETGQRQEITLEKSFVAIVENPLYSVMNEPNSTLQRLIAKLNLLDTVDAQSGSGKLDLIIQLPYVIKSEARRAQAEQRRKDIEFQLAGSQYGIAYTDGTEKITQLNRPAENNLLTQVEYLTEMLYSQLGLTLEVMNGTADEKAMINYFNRTIEPILDAVTQAMQRSFLTSKATDNLERVQYFTDPFRFVPVAQLAEIADKFVRNKILTTNEIRGYIGVKPSKDPEADKLNNPNMPQVPPQLDNAPPTQVNEPSLKKVINMPRQLGSGA